MRTNNSNLKFHHPAVHEATGTEQLLNKKSENKYLVKNKNKMKLFCCEDIMHIASEASKKKYFNFFLPTYFLGCFRQYNFQK